MEIQKEVEFFDRFEAEHGDYDVLGDGAYRRLVELFRKEIRPQPGERCIDLGCGTGAFTRRLRSFGLALEGMDISPKQVGRANQNAAGETYRIGDISATGLESEAYDIIVYSGVIHHFDSCQERVKLLREGARILRPGGRLFAFDPSAHSPSMWLYRDPRSPLFSSKGKTENEVLLNRDQLRIELEEAGLRNVQIRGTSGITFQYVESGPARLILGLYNLYEHAVRFSPWENRLGTFLVTVASR